MLTKSFSASKRCNASPHDAWRKLEEMPRWRCRPNVSTVTRVRVLSDGPFLQPGTRFIDDNPEHIPMACVIDVACPPTHMRYLASNRVLLFKSEVEADIRPEDEGVLLTWRQTYRGWSAFALGIVAGKREKGEVQASLDTWVKELGCGD